MNRNKLTVAFVRKIDRPGRYQDGMGLMLAVTSTGGKSWVQRLTIRGRRRDLGLGAVLKVPLAEARTIALENWTVARSGGDPRVAANAVPTFSEALDTVIAIHREGWKNAGKSEAQWRSSMTSYALPRIGQHPVNSITTVDVMSILLPIWTAKHETARRVRQRIGAVMKWAIAQGHRTDNPAGDAIGAALPRNGAVKAHQRALAYQDVSAALDTAKASHAAPTTVLALEFLTLTATRSGETRLATWAEVDIEAAVWTIPAGRMKQKRVHRVPLSDRAQTILRAAEEYRDDSGLLFPSVRGKTLSDNTLSKLFRDLKIAGTPHGMRSAFRDYAAERSNMPGEIAEMALAHVNSNKVEAAYRRTDLFELRRDLMQRWADYLDRDAGAKVVSIHG